MVAVGITIDGHRENLATYDGPAVYERLGHLWAGGSETRVSGGLNRACAYRWPGSSNLAIYGTGRLHDRGSEAPTSESENLCGLLLPSVCPQRRRQNILDSWKGTGYDSGVMANILDQIRQAIEESDKTRYRIAKDTGISESRLSLLMSGKRGLSIEALEALADYLGLEVALRRKRKRKG